MAGLEKIKRRGKRVGKCKDRRCESAGRTDEDSGAGRRSRTGRTDPEEV